MNTRDLAVKFASYAHYMMSREWAREGAKPPWLLCVAPELAQERRMQRVAQASLTFTTGLVIWTTTAVLLHEHEPLAPIWSPGTSPPGHAAKARGVRNDLRRGGDDRASRARSCVLFEAIKMLYIGRF